MGILELQDRRQVRLFERRDDYGRFVSCLVYLPRDRYSTDRAEQIASALEEAYGGTGTEHEVLIGMGALARLHVRVALGREVRHPLIPDVEKRLAPSSRTGRTSSAPRSSASWARMPASTRSPATATPSRPTTGTRTRRSIAAADVAHLLEIDQGADIITALHRPLGAAPEEVRFTLMRPGAPLVLSEVLPLLEDLGVTVVDERTHEIRVEGRSVWRYDIGLRVSDPGRIDDRATRDEFCDTFAALFRGELESDGLNQLVIAGGLVGPPGRRAPRLREVPAPDRPVVQPALRRDDAGPPRADRRRARAAVRDPVRPVHRSRRRPRRQPRPRRRRPGPHRLDRGAARRRAQPGRGPHPPRRSSP